MPIIIDGWNLVRDPESPIDDDEGDALDSARDLIACMQRFQATHKDPVILVFDSTNEYLDLPDRIAGGITVVPASDADQYIMRLIDRTPERQRRNLRVVSSDSRIYYHAKGSGAQPIKCGKFWDKLARAAAPHEDNA